MRKALYLLFIGAVLSLTSCRKDFDTVASSGELEFSDSKVYLDTVFTDISSSTYTLKVYNHSNKDLTIPKIQLKKGLSSRYRLMVDGMTGTNGKIFDNVQLLAKDSLYIFIEITPTISDTETDFTYNDQILFGEGSTQQSVDLITLIQDAKFIFPTRLLDNDPKETLSVIGLEGVEGHTLTDSELHWTKDKPYVIYGYAAVPTGKTLIIDKGTRVYFHADSGLIVDNGATININGEVNVFDGDGNVTTQNEVTFEGDRLEPDYEDVPGQWGTILLFSGSTANAIEHLTIKNAAVGIFMQRNVTATTPYLTIKNSQIYNSSNYGILARASYLRGDNLVINLAGQTALACSTGGNYEFKHCTFNNNWISSKQLAVSLSNYEENADGTFSKADLVQANFYNSIIYGNNNVEMYLDKSIDTSVVFQYDFQNCLLKFNDYGTSLATDHDYDSIREGNSLGNLTNQDPKFKNANSNKLNIFSDSPAVLKGNPLYRIDRDILGITRTATPDIGAYQSVAVPN